MIGLYRPYNPDARAIQGVLYSALYHYSSLLYLLLMDQGVNYILGDAPGLGNNNNIPEGSALPQTLS